MAEGVPDPSHLCRLDSARMVGFHAASRQRLEHEIISALYTLRCMGLSTSCAQIENLLQRRSLLQRGFDCLCYLRPVHWDCSFKIITCGYKESSEILNIWGVVYAKSNIKGIVSACRSAIWGLGHIAISKWLEAEFSRISSPHRPYCSQMSSAPYRTHSLAHSSGPVSHSILSA
jgi:hypothetical protein